MKVCAKVMVNAINFCSLRAAGNWAGKLGLLLVGLTAQAQPRSPAYVPPHQRQPTELPAPAASLPPAKAEWQLHPGRYQTPDGLWHAARFSHWGHDRVVLHDEDDPLRQLLSPEALRRFVWESEPDTVVTVRNFVLPGRHRVEPPTFARQLLRGRGLTFYTYTRLEDRSWWELLFLPHQGQVLLLQQGAGPVQVLPRSRRRLQAGLLAALADDPISTTSLRARGPRLWRDVEPLLRAYIGRQAVAQTSR